MEGFHKCQEGRQGQMEQPIQILKRYGDVWSLSITTNNTTYSSDPFQQNIKVTCFIKLGQSNNFKETKIGILNFEMRFK